MSRSVLFCLCVVAGSVWFAPASRGDEHPQAEAARIRQLVRQLGSVRNATRDAAARDLLELGPAVVPALQEAAGHRDPEIAARARELLDRIDRLLLFGSRLVLRAEPASVAWDQPFDLIVTIENGAATPCAIPFSPALAAVADLTPDARQAGRLVEIADFLQVRGPDGELIEPHIFDIDDAMGVSASIRRRADGMIVGRQTAQSAKDYRVAEFNRGRMRYRMLSAGRYTIQFVYEPDWGDPALARARVGFVTSNVAEVLVTASAPDEVRDAEGPMQLVVERVGGDMVAYLVSTYDLPASFNLNVGDGGPHFARASWFIGAGGNAIERAMTPTGPFELPRLVRLSPGERTALGRLPVAQVLKAAGRRHGVVVEARYQSTLSRSAVGIVGQFLEPADRAPLDKLPPYLITGSCESTPVDVSSP